MKQEIKNINIKDLVLWTENPRDPICSNSTDQSIADKAFNDTSNKWSLLKLVTDMGGYFDYSEIPTVVYHKDKPIVYDGNRRIILAKIYHSLLSFPKEVFKKVPSFPLEIPCNVCEKETALNNILRKHSETGSWQVLERDIFLNKFMDKGKSTFLLLDENTNLITKNPELNQRFVKEEIFNEENLKAMGFIFKNDMLYSKHTNEECNIILNDIVDKIKNKEITTRKRRRKILEILDVKTQKLLDKNRNKKLSIAKPSIDEKDSGNNVKRHTRRTTKNFITIFGEKLYLNAGGVNDLYRDIDELYNLYICKENKFSQCFPNIIRMALRLLVETAANDRKEKMDSYIQSNFDNAKSMLNKDQKTTLANLRVNKESFISSLQSGAHGYTSSSDLSMCIALSLIIGKMITISHGKTNE